MDEQLARGAVAAALRTVRPGVAMSLDGLVLTALHWDAVREPAYETAGAALAAGELDLREQGSGTVLAIEAATKSRPVVIFAGDTVVGGRQNRIINVTVWLPAGAVTPIPVSCLEHGRWDSGYRFTTSRKVDYGLRAEVSRHLADAAAWEVRAAGAGPGPRRSYAADQGRVWGEISAREMRAGAHSPTAALHDVYDREAGDVGAIASAFPCPAGASGVAVGIGGRLVALELFDAESTLTEQWPRLAEAAASAHADHRRLVAAGAVPPSPHRYPDSGALGRMLSRAAGAAATAVVGRSAGEGLDVRLAGHRVRGGALVVAGRPVHVELFRAAD